MAKGEEQPGEAKGGREPGRHEHPWYDAPLIGVTLPEIKSACAAFAAEAAFPYYWCGVVLRNPPVHPIQLVLTNYPREFIDAYRDHRWSLVDPVLAAVRQRFSAFALEELQFDRRSARGLLVECERFGLERGLVVHVHNDLGERGHLVLAGMPAPTAGAERNHIVGQGQALLGQVCESLRAIVDVVVPEGAAPRLPARQVQALSFSATGLNVAEIAEQMNVSRRTVEELLVAAQRKLGARSHKEALLRAAAMRQIEAVIVPDYYIGERQFLDFDA